MELRVGIMGIHPFYQKKGNEIMLEPKVKSYVLNILEYKMFKDDIITRECSNGYTLKDELENHWM